MGYAVRGRCGQRIAIIRRVGENDDSDRDCGFVVRAYGLRGENRDYVPANQRRGNVSFTINATGQVFKQTIELCTWAGLSRQTDLSIEIARRLQRAWACFQRYGMEIYDRPGVRLRLEVRLLKAEVVKTLLYG